MFETKVNDTHAFTVRIEDGSFFLNDENKVIDIHPVNDHTFQVLYEGGSYTVHVMEIDREEKQVVLKINGKRAIVSLSTELDLLLKRMGFEHMASSKVSNVKAPMPGLIHSIIVNEGEAVSKGDPLIILEAMKMENIIKSPSDGTIEKVHVKQGNNVDKGTIIVSFA